MRTVRITSEEELKPFEHKGEGTRTLRTRRRVIRQGGAIYLPESLREETVPGQ